MGCGATPKQGKDEAGAAPAPGAAPAAAPAPAEPKQPEVPPKKLIAIKAAFQAIDADGSGRINAKELKGLLDKIGQNDLSDQDKEALLKSMDKDSGGEIDFAEFVEWVLANAGANDAVANWSSNKGLGDVHHAAIAGDAEKIKSLVAAGSQVTARDINDVTPLHYACRFGKAESAKALIECKADVSAIASDTKRMPLHAAAENGSTEVIEILLAAGAEVNALDGRLRTPLHWACCSSREAAAALLLESGADVNGKSSAGYTPFAFAQDWSTMALADMVAAKGGTR